MEGISLYLRGLDVLMFLTTVSMGICFVRLFLGPTTPNRTVAFDLIALHAVAVLALASLRWNEIALMDIALITALLGFLSSVLMAHYIEASPHPSERDDP